MDFIKIGAEDFEGLMVLQNVQSRNWRSCPYQRGFESLKEAIEKGQIHFYGCRCDNALVAVLFYLAHTYSTFHYGKAGVFGGFFIQPKYHQDRGSWLFMYEQSGVGSLTVGCADCDLPMYQSLGFLNRWGTCWPLRINGARYRSNWKLHETQASCGSRLRSF